MKNIVNILIKIAIIVGTAYWFPEHIKYTDQRALMMAILVMIVTGIIIGLLALGILLITVLIQHEIAGCATAIAMGMTSGIMQLVAAVHFVQGFEIHGTWTYIILALLIGILSIEDRGGKEK